MSNASLFTRRSYGALLSRLVWPTAALLVATLGIVFATVIWMSGSANEAAGERQRVQIAAAFEQRLEDMRIRLADASARSGALATLLEAAAEAAHQGRSAPLLDFDGVLILGTDRQLVAGFVDGAPADAATLARVLPLVEAPLNLAAAELSPDESPRRRESGGARLLYARGLIAAVAVPLPASNGPGRVAAAFKRLKDADIKRVAELHAIDDVRVGPEPPVEGWVGLPVLDPTGHIGAYVAWRPDRPGDIIRERLVPLVLFGSGVALALFLFVVHYIRWIARDLASSQAHAQNLLGRDPLSGLPNRLLFAERLEHELARLYRSGEGLAVLFLDLDRFKDVNDTFGHAAGDELIKAVARRLSDLLRAGDTLARFGGDEFAVIQTNLKNTEDAAALARRILESVTQPFTIAGTDISVGVSIGIAMAPANGLEREDLMRLADTALYQAKSEGRNRFKFFARQMDETIRMRKVVEDDLRHAIHHDELCLHYQPIVSADGQSIVGVEALVRWPHHKQGLISPARFISIAEERGLVIPLGEWVLRRACRDAQRWPGLRVAVNVSPIQFRHRDFVESVMRALRETQFDPSRLELELTEGVVVEDADAAEAAMMELRALGVHLALDDFGTGYSSLIYLRRFAFDKIKIDRSFLESMEATGESAILVHSIVHLGRALGLTVTAEGVETKEQHRFLQALGCHQLQGFLFSRPVPPEEIDELLTRGLSLPSANAA